MIKNIIRFVVNATGQILIHDGVIRKNSNNYTILQVVSPMDASLGCNISIPNGTVEDSFQYLTKTDKQGHEAVEGNDYYDWYVYESELKDKALLKIMRYRTSKVRLAYKFRQYAPSGNCITYKGTFGYGLADPSTLELGDWWYCTTDNWWFNGLLFAKGEICYYNGSNYVKDTYTESLTFQENVPVDGNITVDTLTASEITTLQELSQAVETLENTVEGLVEGTEGIKEVQVLGEQPIEDLLWVKLEN